MRRAAVGGLSVLLLTVPNLSHALGSLIECSDVPTFNSRGDRWAIPKDGADRLPIVYQQWEGNSDHLPGTDVAGQIAIEMAFLEWQQNHCAGSQPPSAMAIDGYGELGDYPNQDSGGPLDNIVYFVDDEEDFMGTQFTLAVVGTSNLPGGRIISQTMQFNLFQFDWRAVVPDGAGGSQHFGCDPVSGPSAAYCYDIHAVAVHEAGHFFGLDHVECGGAVMFPNGSTTGSPKQLTVHERTGICALYPPANARPGFGDECHPDNGPACGASLVCAFDGTNNVELGNSKGMCTIACSITSDCPDAYVCGTVGGTKVCRPGLHNTGATSAPGANVVDDQGFPVDVCMPCTSGSHCSSGNCVADIHGNGFCTLGCSDDAGCPDDMQCVPLNTGNKVCAPPSGTCAGADQGVYDTRPGLNQLCYDSGTPGEDDHVYNPCQAGLLCFGFKSLCGGDYQYGACVNYCNPTQPCAKSGHTCCYGVDVNGNCITTPPTGEDEPPHGGCFQLRREGETCVSAEQSVCAAGHGCFHFLPHGPEMSKCYRYFSSGCGNEQQGLRFTEECSGTDFDLCCNLDSQTACDPSTTNSLFPLGTSCRRNADCDSGMCMSVDGQSACTRACNAGNTNFGCPADHEDVTGDGNPDGGFVCRLLEGSGWCWPKMGPFEPPATVSSDSSSGCCSAAGAPMRTGDALMSVLVLLLGFVLRRRPARGWQHISG